MAPGRWQLDGALEEGLIKELVLTNFLKKILTESFAFTKPRTPRLNDPSK
jgi:hypothetical protein